MNPKPFLESNYLTVPLGIAVLPRYSAPWYVEKELAQTVRYSNQGIESNRILRILPNGYRTLATAAGSNPPVHAAASIRPIIHSVRTRCAMLGEVSGENTDGMNHDV